MIAWLRFNGIVLGWMATLILLATSCDTQNNVELPDENFFFKLYGGDGDQSAVDLIANEDGSFFILGNWNFGPVTGSRVYLLRISDKGIVLSETLLGTLQDKAKDLETTGDGGLVILCDHQTSTSNIDIKILKLTSEGVVQDSVIYGSPGIERSGAITQLDDDGFIIAGVTEYDTTTVVDPTRPDDVADVFHFRCNANLVFDNILWKSQYGPGTFDSGRKVFQHSSDLFYVFGTSNQPHAGNNAGNRNLFYYSIDGEGANGTPIYLGDFQNETEAAYVLKVPVELGDGFLVLGTERLSNGGVNLFATKLRFPLTFNSLNDAQFQRRIENDSRRVEALSVTSSLVASPGYIIVGNEIRETGRNIWITKIDQNGNKIWSSSIGSEEEDDVAAAVAESDDGRIVVAGTIRLVNNQSKIVLMKLNPEGRLSE